MKVRTFAPNIPLPEFSNSATEETPRHVAQPDAPAAAAPPSAEGKAAPEAAPAIGAAEASRTPSSELAGQRVIRMINVHLIDPNPFAPREVYTVRMIGDRAEDLRSQGQHDPIHVIPHPDVTGRFIIADGWTRVQACTHHKVFEELLAEIHPDLTVQEAAWFGYQQNEGRQDQCDLDRARFYEKMIEAGISANEVARRANISKQLMSNYRSYGKLPEDVIEIIRQYPEKFGSNVAVQLTKLYDKCGVRKTVTLAARFAEEDQPVRWLISQVQAAVNPSDRSSASPLKHIRYTNGYYKQRADGFELSIKVPEEKRDAFAAALEKLLDTVGIQNPPKDTSAESQ